MLKLQRVMQAMLQTTKLDIRKLRKAHGGWPGRRPGVVDISWAMA
jgi:hypothetical protein